MIGEWIQMEPVQKFVVRQIGEIDEPKREGKGEDCEQRPPRQPGRPGGRGSPLPPVGVNSLVQIMIA